ncbi:saccharopine dehydrogenase [Colletotrichum musicola]|uniref:Saccharopine dehydrogenase n=1 Tax=Colletotrichum musicola TaxID=2175873 RepID=A0A8H6J4L7_9PEZI|nr:saccharopine dehydrogenase [Colletotrichum musicola]
MVPKKILVLGSGMVAKPCVDYLLRDAGNCVTIACRTVSSAEALSGGRDRTTAISLDVTSPSALNNAIAGHDVVISLVPFIHHPAVVQAAIKSKTDVVTTSYVSPAIRALETSAREAGITVVNEVGVDPGVDHLAAVKIIEEVREFYSYCGGLPAPEASDNPLRFKLSWSPRGALLSQKNSATFLKDGKEVTIDSRDLMASARPYHVMDGYSFLAYPNRNSVPFREYYQIPEAHTVIRGSLRYKGNPELVNALVLVLVSQAEWQLPLRWLRHRPRCRRSSPAARINPQLVNMGWLDATKKTWLTSGLTWAELQQKATGAASASEVDLVAKVDELCSLPDVGERDAVLSGLRWMGLFSDEEAPVHDSLLDTLSARLQTLCSFKDGERDLVMLQHKFVVEWQDGKTDTITSTLELLGDLNGYQAMSKSVGVTRGIATQLLLDQDPAIAKPGVVAPYTKGLCDAIRARVEDEGIKMVEKVL